jgi:hypothetical protein
MNWISVVRKGPIPIFLAVSVIDGWIFSENIRPFVAQIEAWLGGIILGTYCIWTACKRNLRPMHRFIHEGFRALMLITLAFRSLKDPVFLELAKKSELGHASPESSPFIFLTNPTLVLSAQFLAVVLIGRALVFMVESMAHPEILPENQPEPPNSKSPAAIPEPRMKLKKKATRKKRRRSNNSAHRNVKSFRSDKSDSLEGGPKQS